MENNRPQSQNHNTLTNAGILGALVETTSRYGSAGAEFLKGLRGVDYETGQVFDRSLIKVSQGKLNPEYYKSNLKQQAGYSAEIVSTSRKNAEAIINGEKRRFLRSEDVAGYGKNHKVVDIVELMDTKEISTSQMKFVNNYKGLLNKIAKGEGGGRKDWSRYMGVDKLELPSEQVEAAKQYCAEQSEQCRIGAQLKRQEGDIELAQKLEQQSKNFKELESKIGDSGLTTKEAIKYRLNPKIETLKDIGRVSHRAGVEGAKFGAAIGGSISLVTNIIAYQSRDKQFGEAVIDVGCDTIKSAGVGYGTAFAGTAIKTYMQQSSNATMRSLSGTGLPAMVVSVLLQQNQLPNMPKVKLMKRLC